MEPFIVKSPIPMAAEDQATLSLLTTEERVERFAALWKLAARLRVARDGVVRDTELARLPIEQKVAIVEQLREIAR